jgi:RHS repeat-associated protein
VSACNGGGCSAATASRYFQTPAQPATRTDYIFLSGAVIAEVKQINAESATTSYVHADLLGSPSQTSDAGGALQWSEQYEPYGEKMNGVEHKLGYTGHAHDFESGLTYMQARFYDAQVGRFLSTDPKDFDGASPFTFNRYAYANNNPYKFTDPDGEFVQVAVIATGAIVGGAIGAGLELYDQLKSLPTGGEMNYTNVAAEAGKGAFVGALAVVGGAAGGALATAEGAGATATLAAEAVGSGSGAGLATLSASPAVDMSKGQPVQSHLGEAAAAFVGGVAGTVGGAAIGAGASKAGASAGMATLSGNVGGEALDAAVSGALTPPQPQDRLPTP